MIRVSGVRLSSALPGSDGPPLSLRVERATRDAAA
jgi:hypothetical protein